MNKVWHISELNACVVVTSRYVPPILVYLYLSYTVLSIVYTSITIVF